MIKKVLLMVVHLVMVVQGLHTNVECRQLDWRDWEVVSNEAWNYENGPMPRFPMKFSMLNLFDGDPTTTWVFRGSGGNRYASLRLRSEGRVTIDGLWIMNGYSKRPDLFRRNDRVTELRLVMNRSTVKTVKLLDAMGWHKISLPRQDLKELRVEITGLREGEGPDHDVCISEIALHNRGRKIDMRMPQVAVFSIPATERAIGYVLSRKGNRLATGYYGEDLDIPWNASGNLVAGVELGSRGSRVWVVDANEARIVYVKRFGVAADVTKLRWTGPRTLEADLCDTDSNGEPRGMRTCRITVRSSPARKL